jgi:hypothetical protein
MTSLEGLEKHSLKSNCGERPICARDRVLLLDISGICNLANVVLLSSDCFQSNDCAETVQGP